MTKLEQLENIIKATDAPRTIHKLLQVLEINKREVDKLQKKDKKLYNKLKEQCNKLVADLYELTIDRPRQATQYIQLANQQEELYNKLFNETIEQSIAPSVIIKRDKSTTNINIINNKDKENM